MSFAKFQFHLTNHAFQQYCDRVGFMDYEVLKQQCIEQIQKRDYYKHGDFIQLAGVWWVFDIRAGTMHFVTCYGKTHINIPQAKKWAKRHNDRLHLSEAGDA